VNKPMGGKRRQKNEAKHHGGVVSFLPLSRPGRGSRTRRIGKNSVRSELSSQCGLRPKSPVKARGKNKGRGPSGDSNQIAGTQNLSLTRRKIDRRAWFTSHVAARCPRSFRAQSLDRTRRLCYSEIRKRGVKKFRSFMGYHSSVSRGLSRPWTQFYHGKVSRAGKVVVKVRGSSCFVSRVVQSDVRSFVPNRPRNLKGSSLVDWIQNESRFQIAKLGFNDSRRIVSSPQQAPRGVPFKPQLNRWGAVVHRSAWS